MSKLFAFILVAILDVTMCKLKKTQCVSKGSDCDLFTYCCGEYRCRDYRCTTKETKDNQMKWAPKGDKCDWFHHCPKGKNCQSHRCIPDVKKVVSDLQAKITSN